MLWSWSLDAGQYAEPGAEAVLVDEERGAQLALRHVAAAASLRGGAGWPGSILGAHLHADPRRLAFVQTR